MGSRWFEQPARPRVRLAQALVKGERGELAVELATEAGVDEILPWHAQRCVARWHAGARAEKARVRWENAVTSAAKQARRSYCPTVHPVVSTAELTRAVALADAALVLHESAELSLSSAPLPVTGDVLLVVGPEGGIADEELAALTEAGARSVRLGPTVLRASTAAVVALGALGVLTPRWQAGTERSHGATVD